MASVKDVAEALAATIKNATGLQTFHYVPDDINPPACIIKIDTIDLGAFKLGQMDMTFEAVVLTSRADDRSGQMALYEYLDSSDANQKSIWRAIYDTPALGLSNTNAAVQQMRSLSVEEIAAYGYYGAAFPILVLTSGA